MWSEGNCKLLLTANWVMLLTMPRYAIQTSSYEIHFLFFKGLKLYFLHSYNHNVFQIFIKSNEWIPRKLRYWRTIRISTDTDFIELSGVSEDKLRNLIYQPNHYCSVPFCFTYSLRKIEFKTESQSRNQNNKSFEIRIVQPTINLDRDWHGKPTE